MNEVLDKLDAALEAGQAADEDRRAEWAHGHGRRLRIGYGTA